MKNCIPDELKIHYSKQDEFTVEDGCILRGTRAGIPAKYQAAVLSELHLDLPGMVSILYISNGLRFTMLSEYSVTTEDFESLWIEIHNPHQSNLLCGVPI